MINGQTQFPPQKKFEREKNEKWAKQCIEAACSMGLYTESFTKDYNEVRTNMDLYNNILNVDDMLRMCDPFNIQGNDFPYKPQHYPVPNSKINLLVGEEIKRRFDWRVKVINEDAISEKEKEKVSLTRQLFTDMLTNGVPPEEAQRKIQEHDNYLRYEYQDLRERRATHLLRHMIEKEDMKYKWNMGFLDGLVGGREIYSLDIVNGDPRCRKTNPANMRIIRRGYSPDVQDADIIMEWGYHSKGVVLDTYCEFLTDNEVDMVERMSISPSSDGEHIALGKEPNLLAGTFSLVEDANGQLVASDTVTGRVLSQMNEDGSILVTRVVWRSYRKIGKIKYYDRKTGDVLFKFVDEFYKPNISRGEEIDKWLWVTDWWEGHRIGENIFCKMQPFPVKAYGMTNPTGTLCPYVGGDYTMEGEPTTSLMGRLKPYAYYYDFMMYKQWETLAKHKGVIGYLDLSLIPEGFEIEDALYYAEKMGWMPIDSFKEGRKGQATGKLAGNASDHRPPMNFDMGSYLQQNMLIMNFLKEEMADISGVSRQREGTISSSELVGNTERAVQQSSHITEIYFHFHDRIKVATLKAMLEVAKYAYKGRKINVQYISDDMSQELSMIDGDEFREIDFGIAVGSSPEYSRIQQQLQQLAQAGLQNDKVNFTQIMDIMMDPSIASVRRKIEKGENDKMQREQQSQESQQKSLQQIEQMKQELENARVEFQAQKDQELEQLRINGKLDLEKIKGIIQKSINDATSGDAQLKADLDREINEMKADIEERKLQVMQTEGDKDRIIEKAKVNKPSGSK